MTEALRETETLLRAYPRLKRGASARTSGLDIILSTPKGDAGMPRGQGRHGDPTASRAGALMRREEQARVCQAVEAALRSLPKDQRDIVRAYYFERGASLRELAGARGVSPTTAGKWRDRAVMAMAEALLDEFGGEIPGTV